MKTYAIVLAAGKGTRMKSDLPKVMHKVCGIPMVEHIVRKLEALNTEEIIVVVGHGAEHVQAHLGDRVRYAFQKEQHGTGHAVMQAKEMLGNLEGQTIVLTGDTPLLEESTLRHLLGEHETSKASATVLTTIMPDPTGYGRIMKVRENVIQIVEQKDATEEQRKIQEINTGIFVFDNKLLFQHITSLENANAQGEYYLTDMMSILYAQTKNTHSVQMNDHMEAMGINDRVQLSQAEKYMREKINKIHMLNGVTLIDPESTYIESDVVIGNDTIIHPGTFIYGKSVIGKKCEIGPNTQIKESMIGDRTSVLQSIVTSSTLESDVSVGPFAQLRPGTILRESVKIGNFVEVKNSEIGEGSKSSHLTYIGDATIGKDVNLGCGTVFVNYDGVKKNRSVVEDNAFIGCNANIIAPVTIGKGAYVAAGSTIGKNVPEDALAIARTRQENKEGYAKRFKKEK